MGHQVLEQQATFESGASSRPQTRRGHRMTTISRAAGQHGHRGDGAKAEGCPKQSRVDPRGGGIAGQIFHQGRDKRRFCEQR